MKLYTSISTIFLVWFIGLILIMAIGFNNLPHLGQINSFGQALGNWDGGHFIGIAQNGYKHFFQYAFWPLYPLLIRGVTLLTSNYYLSAFLINIFCLFLGLEVFYKLLRLDYSLAFSKKIIILMLIFPTSFFFLAAYSESLFFLLVVSTFLSLRLSHKKPIYLYLAISLTILASLTRLVGLALILAVLVEVYRQKRLPMVILILIISLSGFLSYCFYLFLKTGQPFYFLIAEQYWQRNLTFPGLGFWNTIQNFSGQQLVLDYGRSLLELVFSVLGVGLILRSIRFLRPSYVIYGFCSILLPLLTPSLSSMPRFLLVVFPIFIMLGQVKSRLILVIYLLMSVSLLMFFSISFILGNWVS